MNQLTRSALAFAVVLGTVFLLQVPAARAQSNNEPKVEKELIGTWVMNVDKSRFNPNVQMDKRNMVFTPAANDEIHCVITTDETGVFGGGNQKVQSQYTAGLDGKPYPTPDLAVATVTFKPMDGNTIERDGMRKGKEVETYTMKLSDGGKMLTVTVSGTNPGGMPYSSTQIYTKQESGTQLSAKQG